MSSRFLDYFDRVWRWWTVLSGLVIVAGIGFAAFVLAAQSRKDDAFVRANLLPLVRFVETFREERGRLPTEEEFADRAGKTGGQKKVEYYPRKPAFVSDWGTPGHDFVVGATRGEWMHYYRSWDGKDFAGEMAPFRESAPPHH